MEDVGIVRFYEDARDEWLDLVRATKNFVQGNFPAGSPIRRDDVAKALHPILEVHEDFKDFRNDYKLRGKFWIKDFADLLIDRTWDELEGAESDEDQTER